MAKSATSRQPAAAKEGGVRFRQPMGTIAYDRIGLGEAAARQVVGLLNQDLATYYTLFHMYRKHHWCVQGPQFYELHLLLEKNYTEVDLHGDLIAERIRVLGGVPVSGPAAQQAAAYMAVEPEGILPLRQSLEGDLRAEGEIARRLREHIQTAMELGDYGTEDTLKELLTAAEERADALAHSLERETLAMLEG
jgi:DNA-binding ferritin-like protein